MLIASIFSCFTTLVVIIYASLTLNYGEEEEDLNHVPIHVVHTVSVSFVCCNQTIKRQTPSTISFWDTVLS